MQGSYYHRDLFKGCYSRYLFFRTEPIQEFFNGFVRFIELFYYFFQAIDLLSFWKWIILIHCEIPKPGLIGIGDMN